MGTDANRGMVKSDETLFRILDALADLEIAGVTEIANRVDVSKGTVHKHLKTLARHEYVVNRDGKYRLSHKFIKYSTSVMNFRLCNHARPKVTDLADKTGEMVTFAVMENDYGAFVYNSAITENRGDVLTYGWRFELYEAGVGKVMLAELSDVRVRQFLDEIGAVERLDTDELFEELRSIRERGYDIDGAVQAGIESVSAPVVDPKTNTIGALSIIGPPRLLTEERIEDEYAGMLLEATDRINFELRY